MRWSRWGRAASMPLSPPPLSCRMRTVPSVPPAPPTSAVPLTPTTPPAPRPLPGSRTRSLLSRMACVPTVNAPSARTVTRCSPSAHTVGKPAGSSERKSSQGRATSRNAVGLCSARQAASGSQSRRNFSNTLTAPVWLSSGHGVRPSSGWRPAAPPPRRFQHSRARPSSSSRSRSLPVRAAARSNSCRASSRRPSRNRRSARTEGSR